MPVVSRLDVTPVKGLALLHPDEVEVGPGGVATNRRFYLIDERGRLFSGYKFGPLVRVRPEYDAERDHLALRFPDGEVAAGGVELGEPVETDFYGRPVTGRVVRGPWADGLSALARKPVRLVKADAGGGAFDIHPVTVLSEESVAELARRAGAESLDGRRFRMLLTISGCGPHEEDTWNGSRVRFGDVVLRMLGPVPRCVVTTRDPDTGVRDFDTLKQIKAYRGLRAGRKIDFGVYAEVEEPGRVRVGDRVEPEAA